MTAKRKCKPLVTIKDQEVYLESVLRECQKLRRDELIEKCLKLEHVLLLYQTGKIPPLVDRVKTKPKRPLTGVDLIGTERRRQVDKEHWSLTHNFKPKEALRDLVRAGALIAAEIDRLLRTNPNLKK